MAKSKSKKRRPSGGGSPARMLLLFFALLVGGGAAMVATDSTSPKLAIDLDGGTQVTLTARSVGEESKVTSENMKEAVKIIRQRVNGFGVSEAQVTTLGKDNIVVAVPGENSGNVAQQVGQTALLRFRAVLRLGPPGPTTPEDISAPGQIPGLEGLGGTADDAKDPKKDDAKKDTAKKDEKTDQNRAVSSALTADPSASPSPSATASPAPSASATPAAGAAAPKFGQAALNAVPKEVNEEYFRLDCSKPDPTRIGDTSPADAYVVACDREGLTKLLLAPSAVQGTQVKTAEAGLPQGTASVGAWQVNLEFDGDGTRDFAAVTKALANQPSPFNQLAIALDGVVQSAPTVNEEIPSGSAQISGGFDQSSASDLANVLKYGALPLAFTQSKVETVSATLGEDQLRGGLIAGALGLLLVIVYSIFFYRGLGVVALLGLLMAGVMSLMAVALLGEAMNYRLSIAGVAGLIVAIGITADSFVVFFERLRDEIRDGRTPRVAVEQGWKRAWRTIQTANVVSLLGAVVLYYFSVADVKGFAFTLGVATVINIVVTFLFAKPLVTLMFRRPYFAKGGRFSGASPENLGMRSASVVRPATPKEA
ncbi:MAG: protein translocase subunit SecD [Sporichthyaceae bacterium]